MDARNCEGVGNVQQRRPMAQDDPVVSAQWLQQHLGQPDVKILDASWYMPRESRDAWQEYQIIYSWDLEQRPIFGNLKTLLLNDWFTTICTTEKLIGTTGAQETVKESFVCAHLKVVNIECGKVNEGIHKILKILSTCGVCHKQISIKDPCSRSDRFNFQKRPTAAATSTMDGA